MGLEVAGLHIRVLQEFDPCSVLLLSKFSGTISIIISTLSLVIARISHPFFGAFANDFRFVN